MTSAPGAYWQTGGAVATVAGGDADVTVDDSATAQIWEGFGGAFNEKGWSYLSMLSDADRDTRARPALRRGRGAVRVRPDPDRGERLRDRSLHGRRGRERHRRPAGQPSRSTRDMMWLIPYVKAAQAVKGNIRFWASPWTPPTWMKQGPFSAGNVVTPFDGGTMKTDDATMKAFAQYLIKFVQAYAQQGIKSRPSPRRTSRTTPGPTRPAGGRPRPTRRSSASISAPRSPPRA